MKRLAVACLSAVLLLTVSAPAFAAKKDKASIKVINQSDWAVHHLFLSSSSDDDWGPDQLGEDVLEKGDSMTLTDVPCDEYDIKVVDEDGDECVIEAVQLCNDHSYWKITNKELLGCEGYGD
jgi:hypothetical protein